MPDVPPELLELLRKLSTRKLAHVSGVVTGLLGDMTEKRNEKSDLVTEFSQRSSAFTYSLIMGLLHAHSPRSNSSERWSA